MKYHIKQFNKIKESMDDRQLDTDKYKVYVKNFNKSDNQTVVIAQDSKGNMYYMHMIFIKKYPSGWFDYVYKDERIQYLLNKIKENPARVFDYEVTN